MRRVGPAGGKGRRLGVRDVALRVDLGQDLLKNRRLLHRRRHVLLQLLCRLEDDSHGQVANLRWLVLVNPTRGDLLGLPVES